MQEMSLFLNLFSQVMRGLLFLDYDDDDINNDDDDDDYDDYDEDDDNDDWLIIKGLMDW